MLNEEKKNCEELCDCKEMSSSELDEVAGGRGNGGYYQPPTSKAVTQKHSGLARFLQKLFYWGSKCPDAQRQKYY